MKILLSCVNSAVSLIGYDLSKREAFWYLPADRLRATGACMDGEDLVLASDNYLTRVAPDGVTQLQLPGPHPAMAHSVRKLGDGTLGVADTGNSRVLMLEDQSYDSYSPLEPWQQSGIEVPPDAIHLNDFVETPHGIFASCFHFAPFRPVREAMAEAGQTDFDRGGFGVILALEKHGGAPVCRVAACGLNTPHSLTWQDGELYVCAGASGELVRLTPTGRGGFLETRRWSVTDSRFLRGALHTPEGWVLGGSSRRQGGTVSTMALYLHDDQGILDAVEVAGAGEIYEILPWDDAAMAPLVKVMDGLPQQQWAQGTFPPICPRAEEAA